MDSDHIVGTTAADTVGQGRAENGWRNCTTAADTGTALSLTGQEDQMSSALQLWHTIDGLPADWQRAIASGVGSGYVPTKELASEIRIYDSARGASGIKLCGPSKPNPVGFFGQYGQHLVLLLRVFVLERYTAPFLPNTRNLAIIIAKHEENHNKAIEAETSTSCTVG